MGKIQRALQFWTLYYCATVTATVAHTTLKLMSQVSLDGNVCVRVRFTKRGFRFRTGDSTVLPELA